MMYTHSCVWALIQLYSMFLFNLLKNFDTPHGMLLYPAINYNGFIKKLIKDFFTYFKILFIIKKILFYYN